MELVGSFIVAIILVNALLFSLAMCVAGYAIVFDSNIKKEELKHEQS